MIRIWKGPEMEGSDIGQETLFVCSDNLLNIEFIKKIILNNNVFRVYLGAGRQLFRGFSNCANSEFVEFCKKYNIKVIIETEFNYLDKLIDFLHYAQIIITIREDSFKISDMNDIKFKIDDYLIARVYNTLDFVDTDLSDVRNNKYSCDEIIYEEE